MNKLTLGYDKEANYLELNFKKNTYFNETDKDCFKIRETKKWSDWLCNL